MIGGDIVKPTDAQGTGTIAEVFSTRYPHDAPQLDGTCVQHL